MVLKVITPSELEQLLVCTRLTWMSKSSWRQLIIRVLMEYVASAQQNENVSDLLSLTK